jgi:preprotein translocase subunit SecE
MVSPITFLKETNDELKKVTWPTRADTIRLTGIVLFISFVVGLYIGALDYIFTMLLEVFIGV